MTAEAYPLPSVEGLNKLIGDLEYAVLARVQGLPESVAKLSDAKAAIRSYAERLAVDARQQSKARVSEYLIPGDPRRMGSDDIRVALARQIDGTEKWAVRHMGNCLNQSGEWEYEPMPSSRDDEFLTRCRFDSADAAIDAALSKKEQPHA